MKEYLYTVKEVADLLKVNKNFVYRLIKAGLLTGLKLGALKVTREELESFLKRYNGKDLSDPDNIKELKVS